MNDSVITCDEIIDVEETCKTQNLYILLTFLLISLILLKVISISCYLIKYRAKKKHCSGHKI